MALRTETCPPGGSASEFASRVVLRRRGATVLAHAVTTAGVDQRADGQTLRFRAGAADRRERRLRRACLVAAFSRPGGAEIFLPAKH
jgi:hypothetical protein